MPNSIDDDGKSHVELDEDRALKALKQAESPLEEDADDDSDEDTDDTKSHVGLDEDRDLKALKQAETKLDEDTDDDSDEDDDDDDADDEYDDEDDDEDEDDISDEEEIMTECPDYCRCSGQYAAATTARYNFLTIVYIIFYFLFFFYRGDAGPILTNLFSSFLTGLGFRSFNKELFICCEYASNRAGL